MRFCVSCTQCGDPVSIAKICSECGCKLETNYTVDESAAAVYQELVPNNSFIKEESEYDTPKQSERVSYQSLSGRRAKKENRGGGEQWPHSSGSSNAFGRGREGASEIVPSDHRTVSSFGEPEHHRDRRLSPSLLSLYGRPKQSHPILFQFFLFCLLLKISLYY